MCTTWAWYGCHALPAQGVWLPCAARRPRLSADVSLTCYRLQIPHSEVAFRGLAVRMAVAYGKVSKARVHPMTMRIE